jgi:hypothetical protein
LYVPKKELKIAVKDGYIQILSLQFLEKRMLTAELNELTTAEVKALLSPTITGFCIKTLQNTMHL